jgi:molybdopterin converting factor small subunit
MSVEVFLPPSLQRLISDIKHTQVEGNTVGECLDKLIEQFPQLKSSLFNRLHKLQSGFSVYINNENVSPKELTRPVNNGDKIYIINILVGG